MSCQSLTGIDGPSLVDKLEALTGINGLSAAIYVRMTCQMPGPSSAAGLSVIREPTSFGIETRQWSCDVSRTMTDEFIRKGMFIVGCLASCKTQTLVTSAVFTRISYYAVVDGRVRSVWELRKCSDLMGRSRRAGRQLHLFAIGGGQSPKLIQHRSKTRHLTQQLVQRDWPMCVTIRRNSVSVRHSA